MKTMKWNGEHWYCDTRSLWLRLRQWIIWVGGWESGGHDDRPHRWKLWIRDYPGKPIRKEPMPISLLNHRITHYGWGTQLRVGRGYLVFVRARPWMGTKPRLYLSTNGTPRGAYHWVFGWNAEDISEDEGVTG